MNNYCTSKRLSVLLPAYNEAKSLEKTIIEFSKILDRITEFYELIIIDDGSTDNTMEIVSYLSSLNNKVKGVHYKINKGMGYAIKKGFAVAQYEWLLYVDADNQIRLNSLKDILPMLEQTDIAIGYRVNRADTFIRIQMSYFYNKFISLFINFKIKDLNCGFKLFHKDVLKTISLTSNQFFFSTELLIKAHNNSVKIKEFPIKHFARLHGKSAVSLRTIMMTLQDILLISLNAKKLR